MKNGNNMNFVIWIPVQYPFLQEMHRIKAMFALSLLQEVSWAQQ